jgi:hypothetical protein
MIRAGAAMSLRSPVAVISDFCPQFVRFEDIALKCGIFVNSDTQMFVQPKPVGLVGL